MSLIIRIGNRVDHHPDPFAGAFLQEFDGSRIVTTADGCEHWAFMVTDDRSEAKQFETVEAAITYWHQSIGTRADGQPDRPLTEYCMSVQEF